MTTYVIEEYPNDLAFSIIQRVATAVSSCRIEITHPNPELKASVYQRLDELKIRDAVRKYVLNYYYGGQCCAYLLGDGAPETRYQIGAALKKINVLSFSPLFNEYWVPLINPKSFLSDNHGVQMVSVGGNTLLDRGRFVYFSDYKKSAYELIKPYANTLDAMMVGIDQASSRLGIFLSKINLENNVADFQNWALSLKDMGTSRNSFALNIPTDADLTNVSMDLSGVDVASQLCYYNISACLGIPQNVLMGKGQGVSASAEEDNRQFAMVVKYRQEQILRPLYERVLRILMLEENGFDYEDLTFEFVQDAQNTELENVLKVKREVEIVKMLFDMGVPIKNTALVAPSISSILESMTEEVENSRDYEL